jgi:hypothetical protein
VWRRARNDANLADRPARKRKWPTLNTHLSQINRTSINSHLNRDANPIAPAEPHRHPHAGRVACLAAGSRRRSFRAAGAYAQYGDVRGHDHCNLRRYLEQFRYPSKLMGDKIGVQITVEFRASRSSAHYRDSI